MKKNNLFMWLLKITKYLDNLNGAEDIFRFMWSINIAVLILSFIIIGGDYFAGCSEYHQWKKPTETGIFVHKLLIIIITIILLISLVWAINS